MSNFILMHSRSLVQQHCASIKRYHKKSIIGKTSHQTFNWHTTSEVIKIVEVVPATLAFFFVKMLFFHSHNLKVYLALYV